MKNHDFKAPAVIPTNTKEFLIVSDGFKKQGEVKQ
jgi:hypothetical protein